MKHNDTNLQGVSNEEMQSAELEIVIKARKIAQNGEPLRQRFDRLVELYDNQRTIRPTDTKSKLLQQYSTPCPLAFLASEYVKQDGEFKQYFEPSAGNGMLTISLPKSQTTVNELDEVRVANLQKQGGFANIMRYDASERIFTESPFNGVITNPPFKSLPKNEQITVNGFTLATLDYKMAYVALEQMRDDGRAAVIVGGKMFDNYWKPLSKTSDKKVLFGQWKVFLGWLYAAYNVEDLIYIGGDYIYRKQGTTYPVVLILINGRRKKFSTEYKPDYVFNPEKNRIVTTYEQLFARVAPTILKHSGLALLATEARLALRKKQALSGLDGDNVDGYYYPCDYYHVPNYVYIGKRRKFKNKPVYAYYDDMGLGKSLLAYHYENYSPPKPPFNFYGSVVRYFIHDITEKDLRPITLLELEFELIRRMGNLSQMSRKFV